ncbi:MAG: hypothetical protein H6905_03240 [Hyphomicrobiales bacterium]|nr:hypothetical protein [Hyphomicrobiales bacterium]
MTLRTVSLFLAVLLFFHSAGALAAPEGSGLPLPRFVSLRAAEANMRTGPGQRYPIKWVYQRAFLPLEIVAEYHHWRRVRDVAGTEGWIHKNMLSGRRYVLVVTDRTDLHAEASMASPLIGRMEAMVIGRLLDCPAKTLWCQIEVNGMRGWVARTDLWGIYPNEILAR